MLFKKKSSQAYISVEMDPEDAINVRKKIEAKKGQNVVGWYHSHPTFEPEPSNIDIDNQFNYQKLFLEQDKEFEPFIGIIIGTFDIRLPTEESEINFFSCKRNRIYKENTNAYQSFFYSKSKFTRRHSFSDPNSN